MSKKTTIRDAEQVMADILDVDLDECEVHLCLASIVDEDEAPEIQRVQISTDVTDEFKAIVSKTFAKRHIDSERQDLVIKNYDPGAKLDSHEVEWLTLEKHEDIGTQIEALDDISALDLFEEDEGFISKLRFYVIVILPPDGDPLYCFRVYTPKRELNRSRFFAIVMKRGTYDRFDDKLFMFDQGIDCVLRGTELFIFSKSNFQTIFRFYEMLRKSALETLAVIREKVPIDDFESFEAACEGHLQKLAKLKNIASKPYLQKITMKDLKKVIERYELPIETVGRGEKERIKFDASDKWAILRLLDDDYLESVMTGNSYEANSKRAI